MISDVRGLVLSNYKLFSYKTTFKETTKTLRLHLLEASMTGCEVSREVPPPSDASNALIRRLPSRRTDTTF